MIELNNNAKRIFDLFIELNVLSSSFLSGYIEAKEAEFMANEFVKQINQLTERKPKGFRIVDSETGKVITPDNFGFSLENNHPVFNDGNYEAEDLIDFWGAKYFVIDEDSKILLLPESTACMELSLKAWKVEWFYE